MKRTTGWKWERVGWGSKTRRTFQFFWPKKEKEGVREDRFIDQGHALAMEKSQWT